MTGVGAGAGLSPRSGAAGLESEDVPARGSAWEQLAGAGGLGVFGGGGVAVAAAPADSGAAGGPGQLCIFFRLSSSGLALGAGRLAGEAAAAAGTVGAAAAAVGAGAGREKVRGAWLLGGFSGAESEAASVVSSRTLLNHCNEAFFSMSKSSAVTA